MSTISLSGLLSNTYQGAVGFTGSQGIPGSDGATGFTGSIGFTGSSGIAETVSYDNTNSGLAANNVQTAIDEIADDIANLEQNSISDGDSNVTVTDEDKISFVFNGVEKGFVNDDGLTINTIKNSNVFYYNAQRLTQNTTISSTHNTLTVGPMTIDEGVTLTIAVGGEWSII